MQENLTVKLKKGFTLIEIMLAIIIVSILVAGGLRYTVLSATLIQNQKDTRCADVIAAGRMELLLARSYADYIEDADDLGVDNSQAYFYMQYNSANGLFTAKKTDPQETVTINNTTGKIRARARIMDTKNPGNTVVSTCVELEVLVQYGPDNKRSLCMKNIHTY